MDEFENIAKEAEIEGLSASQHIIKLLLSMWENAGKDLRAATSSAKRMRIISIISAVLSCVCLVCCIYMGAVIYQQSGEIAAIRGEIESIHRILDAGVVVEETTTTTETTTQTVEGDTATINNGTFEQYNNTSANGGDK